MDDFTGVLIVAIVFSFIAFSVYMQHKTERFKAGVDDLEMDLSKENKSLKERTEALEQRVQVLEKIVTGKEYQLKEEIDSLT
ncbi:MAG: hypothetical protein GKR91_15755 [Pseudomonadales bacterium]|nr:hypothetical protein [Pseudomonadales bacterium]